MNYYLGIDGGGTKTAYLLIDEKGNEITKLETLGSSYKDYGVDAVIDIIYESIEMCMDLAKHKINSLRGIVIGLPCYGESRLEDALIKQKLNTVLGDIPFYLTNDVEVGFIGSLGLQPGVNVVAGTGSIAFGKNKENECARSGGWSTFFGDEGSCYWLGRRTMELFSKQADYRLDRSELYALVMEQFKLKDPIDFIDLMEKEYVPKRSKVASLQKILLKAAKAGDQSAIELYQCATDELFMLIHSVAKQLDFIGRDFKVSFSGGLFHAKEFIVPNLECMTRLIGGHLTLQIFTPVQGAALLAVSLYANTSLDLVYQNLTNKVE